MKHTAIDNVGHHVMPDAWNGMSEVRSTSVLSTQPASPCHSLSESDQLKLLNPSQVLTSQ